MKIDRFDTEILRTLRNDINAALEKLGKKYGVTFNAGNCTFEAQSCKFQLNISTLGEDGKPESVEAKNFKTFSHILGMKAEDLGKTVRLKGKDYVITGINSRCTHIIATTGGQGYKIPVVHIKKALNS